MNLHRLSEILTQRQWRCFFFSQWTLWILIFLQHFTSETTYGHYNYNLWELRYSTNSRRMNFMKNFIQKWLGIFKFVEVVPNLHKYKAQLEASPGDPISDKDWGMKRYLLFLQKQVGLLLVHANSMGRMFEWYSSPMPLLLAVYLPSTERVFIYQRLNSNQHYQTTKENIAYRKRKKKCQLSPLFQGHKMEVWLYAHELSLQLLLMCLMYNNRSYSERHLWCCFIGNLYNTNRFQRTIKWKVQNSF